GVPFKEISFPSIAAGPLIVKTIGKPELADAIISKLGASVNLSTIGSNVICCGAFVIVKSCNVTVAASYSALPACDAVIVVVPKPMMVTLFPNTVATSALEEV